MSGLGPAFLVIQGQLKPGGEPAYRQYLAGTRPLLEQYAGEIVAVGEGVPSAHTSEHWPINAMLRFPSREAADGFLADPGYLLIKQAYRDVAYDTLHLSLFVGRPPRAL